MNFFQGHHAVSSNLASALAYPTELLNRIYDLPLVPGYDLPFNLLFTLNAVRLNLEYARAQRGVDRGYLQSLLSVIILPCVGGIVASVLLQQTPGFIVSDRLLPTHFFVHFLLFFSPIIKAFLLSLPSVVVDLPLVVADAILRTLAVTTYGSDLAIRSPYSYSWFTQIAVGGLCGSSAAIVLSAFSLWSPTGWRFTSENLSPVTWEMYGPFILSTTYVALRGTHPVINNLFVFATAGAWGIKGQRYLTADEARTVIAIIFATVVTLRRLGIYSFSFGRPQGRTLGTQPTDKKFK